MLSLIYAIDYIVYILMALSCFYLLYFSIFSLKKKYKKYEQASKLYHYVILFPAYKEDKVILGSVETFMKQNYPSELYDIVVISDKMEDETNRILSALPIKLLIVNFENSSKAKALNFALDNLDDKKYDGVIIMDADNVVEQDFLTNMNNAFASGLKAIQAHRAAKNQNTDVSVLDGISEEINNSIFRKGFVRAGFSATLSGSGMLFEYTWFRNNISKLFSSGEDKELEAILLKDRIFVEYLEDVHLYDEKTQQTEVFYQQRRRWLAAQYGTLKICIKDLPQALKTSNWDYCNKLLQWMMLPRIMLIGLITIITLLWTLINWTVSIKWWAVLFILFLALFIAVPRDMFNLKLLKALWKIPTLFFLMFLNFFRMKGAYKNFIHTEHDTKHT